MVRSIDIAPTVLDLVAFEGPRPEMDGRSLLPLLRDTSGADAEPDSAKGNWAYADLLTERVFGDQDDTGNVNEDLLFVKIDMPWKCIHHLERPQESELYHLVNDPDEAINLLTARPDLATRYSRELQGLDPLPKGPVPESQMDEEELERLRALGYVGN